MMKATSYKNILALSNLQDFRQNQEKVRNLSAGLTQSYLCVIEGSLLTGLQPVGRELATCSNLVGGSN
jgi:hypothetical protein